MHEYSIVQQLVEDLLLQCHISGIRRVKEVYLRGNSMFSEEALCQAYQMLTEGTMLAGSELIIEEVEVEHNCNLCGHFHVVTPDDMVGHLFICPECGGYQEIDEAHGLEVLSVTVEGLE